MTGSAAWANARCAIDGGVARQGTQALQRVIELLGSPAQKTPAACTEEGVTGEQDARSVVRNVRIGMPGNRDHAQVQRQIGELHLVGVAHPPCNPFNAAIHRTKHHRFMVRDKSRHTTGMIGVMVGEQDGGEFELVLCEIGLNHFAIAWINHGGSVANPQQPDIVILERGQGNDFEAASCAMLSSHGEDSLAKWFATPQGQYVLRWEQTRLDAMVADIFGYNALQLGLPENEFLRTNRISFRFSSSMQSSADILTEPHALPFASASLDLVVLPHALELSPQPPQVLREVERVLVSEGSAIIVGFNPYSLWGARKLMARKHAEAPWRAQFYSASRIRDWLTLLGFETQSGDFGCYAPPLATKKWLERWCLLDKMGGRWWPVGGGVYVLHAIKRAHGMHLIAPNWRDLRAAEQNLSPVARRGRGVVGNAHKSDLH